VFAQRPAKVPLEDGEPPVAAGRLAAGVPGDGVGQQVGLDARIEGPPLVRREPVGIQRKITPIGRQRVRRKTVLDPQRIEEAIDRLLACFAFGRGWIGSGQTVTPA
jgi:hypothetical protein